MALLAGQVRGDDEVDLLLDVVEGEYLVEEHQAGVGHAEFVLGQRGQALDLADDVVAEESDGAGGERGQSRQARGRVAAERLLQLGEDVALEAAAIAALFDGDRRSARDDLLVRLDADEGIAADVLAALDRFEQKRLGLVGGDAQEGRDGRLEVRRDGAVDGDERVLVREAPELG